MFFYKVDEDKPNKKKDKPKVKDQLVSFIYNGIYFIRSGLLDDDSCIFSAATKEGKLSAAEDSYSIYGPHSNYY